MEAGLYLHIPFCKSKCAYCDFASFAGQEQYMAAYTQAVLREIRQKAKAYPFIIRTLFIGGGTPSVFPAKEMDTVLSALRRHFSFTDDAECTCECNPGTVTEDFLSVLKKHGVNRLSFGAQAAQPHLLRMLGRIHT
ncbi:MAG: radical SAM protein, partial [Clostridia bacterium]|nr:radical SAM protein [Clostridia bacterium]